MAGSHLDVKRPFLTCAAKRGDSVRRVPFPECERYLPDGRSLGNNHMGVLSASVDADLSARRDSWITEIVDLSLLRIGGWYTKADPTSAGIPSNPRCAGS